MALEDGLGTTMAGVPVAEGPAKKMTRNGSARSFPVTTSSTTPWKASLRSLPRVRRKPAQPVVMPWPSGSPAARASQPLDRRAFQSFSGAWTSAQTEGSGGRSDSESATAGRPSFLAGPLLVFRDIVRPTTRTTMASAATIGMATRFVMDSTP